MKGEDTEDLNVFPSTSVVRMTIRDDDGKFHQRVGRLSIYVGIDLLLILQTAYHTIGTSIYLDFYQTSSNSRALSPVKSS